MYFDTSSESALLVVVWKNLSFFCNLKFKIEHTSVLIQLSHTQRMFLFRMRVVRNCSFLLKVTQVKFWRRLRRQVRYASPRFIEKSTSLARPSKSDLGQIGPPSSRWKPSFSRAIEKLITALRYRRTFACESNNIALNLASYVQIQSSICQIVKGFVFLWAFPTIWKTLNRLPCRSFEIDCAPRTLNI